MANSCIVCGKAAGSGEHVFPAALGGRRTNKNIYCATHDNSYSSLVAVLANQLDVFNSLLGVVPDRSKDVKSVIAREVSTGVDVKLSVKESKFTAHRVITQYLEGSDTHFEMAFPDKDSIREWLAEQTASSVDVAIVQKAEETRYLLDTVQFNRKFGGMLGLAAIGYIAQTHLAQEFAELCRSKFLEPFVAYTQAVAKIAQLSGGCWDVESVQADSKMVQAHIELESALEAWGGVAPVWWDFDPHPEEAPNAFEFGHRVTIGVDVTEGQVFGRVSFFSTLNFCMCFGVLGSRSTARNKIVTIDIDPLAEFALNDILKTEYTSASAQLKPQQYRSDLQAAVSSKTHEHVISDLLKRLEDYSLKKVSKQVHALLADCSCISESEAEALIREVLISQSQRVWNLTKYVVQEFKSKLPENLIQKFRPKLDALIAHDSSAPNGLSTLANATLYEAVSALCAQMLADIRAGSLDEVRIAALIAEGEGAAVIGKVILATLV